MVGRSRLLRACAAAWTVAWAAGAAAAAPHDAGGVFKATPSVAARQILDWIRTSGDALGRPHAVVDKRTARIYVFRADGSLAGESEVLLGETVGDFITPGVGERAQNGTVRADERTTPAGRFEARPGRNLKGEHVVWADYESAFAIHRLRPDRFLRTRQARLASASPADNRASLGCVVVPVAFYRDVVERVLGQGRSVVYVLPETRSLGEWMAQLPQP